MIKVLIVEDEKWEREGLVDFVDWSRMGMTVAGTASNGVQGLKLVKEHRPDIIITDIRMPIMDGIEFSQKARAILPAGNFIILTGYDHFEYAREAIRLGACEYLLKPVNKEQLLEVLSKTVKKISEESKQEEYIYGLKHQMAESRYEEKERALTAMLRGDAEYLKNPGSMDGSNIVASKEGISAVIIRFGVYSSNYGKTYVERRLFLKKMCTVIRDLIGEKGIAVLSDLGACDMIICLPSAKNLRGQIYDMLDSIKREYEVKPALKIVAGVGSPAKSPQLFGESFKQAQFALEQLFFLKDAEIVFYDDLCADREPHEAEILDFFSSAAEYSKKVLNGLLSMDSIGITALTEELFKFIETRSLDKGLVCNFIAGLSSEISTLLISYDSEFSFKILGGDTMETLQQFIRLEDLKSWFRDIILHANYCILEKKNNKEEYIVGKVMDIIGKEYQSSLGIETIARRLELSPNYLGRLFKQYIGKSFTEILTDVRMKKAEELLVAGVININETAKAVGYINISHFYKAFKKIYGISPGDYKNKYIKVKGTGDKDGTS